MRRMEKRQLISSDHEAPKPKGNNKPPGAGRLLLELVIKLLIVAGIAYLAVTYVMGISIQHGNRMYPFVMDGDLVVTYKLSTYRVGDVVAYKSPVTGKAELSRIVAIGAYEIDVTNTGELLVNGYTPGEKVFYRTEKLENARIQFPYEMTPKGYFLLDDFRTQGEDSRVFGQITKDDLIGKVVYVIRRRGI